MKKLSLHDLLQYVISIAALVFSALALMVAMLELGAARQQLDADVWPYLQISISPTSDGLNVELSNRGMGPAIIRRAVMRDDAENVVIDLASPSPSQWRPFFPTGSGVELASSWAQGRAISPNEDVRIIGLTATSDPEAASEATVTVADLLDIFINNAVEVCFCSITGDCWIERSDSLAGPQPAPVCLPHEADE